MTTGRNFEGDSVKGNKRSGGRAILYAVAAALFYAANMPFSKMLLKVVPATMMAGLLYLGAGFGAGAIFLANAKKTGREALLSKADLPYAAGMVALDILAPISLMYGLSHTTSANASLLNNFEIVATAVIAFALFGEKISKRLWAAILLVTVSSVILSFEGTSGLRFSRGSVFVLLASVLWGLENNCTRSIAAKNTLEIVAVKGLCSGAGSLTVGFVLGERLPAPGNIALVMLLGFVAYGLSIFCYLKAQRTLGAAKTSAYYAIAPFVGALASFVLLKERFSAQYLAALIFMLAGSAAATRDTLRPESARKE